MTAVLITRPRAAAETLASELQRHGYEAIIEPLLDIVPSAGTLPTAKVEAVMITSAHALDSIAADRIAHLLTLPCFCVGPKTADKARQFGFTSVSHSVSDGKELAVLIVASLLGKQPSVLHIAGQDTTSATRDDLHQAGITVVPWVVYAAKAVETLSPATEKRLKNGQIDAVLLFSTRSAETFLALLEKHSLQASSKVLAAIGLSEAVITPLKPLTWRHLTFAPKPSEDAMIACLKRICPVKA